MARYRDICNGNTESTIFLSRKDFATSGGDAHSASGRGKSLGKPWNPVGPDSDYAADLCLEAVGATDGSHYRPIWSGRADLGTA